MNNIAKGYESGIDAFFIRYLNISKASCGEVRSMLYAGEDLNFLHLTRCTINERKNNKTQLFNSKIH